MGYQQDLEVLNDHLNEQVEKLKEEIQEKDKQIEKMNEGLQKYFSQFVHCTLPFGMPNDSKNIEVLMTKQQYEKEIVPYNKLYNAFQKAERKSIDEAPEDLKNKVLNK